MLKLKSLYTTQQYLSQCSALTELHIHSHDYRIDLELVQMVVKLLPNLTNCSVVCDPSNDSEIVRKSCDFVIVWKCLEKESFKDISASIFDTQEDQNQLLDRLSGCQMRFNQQNNTISVGLSGSPFYGGVKSIMDRFTKYHNNVISLSFNSGYFKCAIDEHQYANATKLCPHLETLKITMPNDMKSTELMKIAEYCPNLKHFTLKNDRFYVGKPHIVLFLRAMPQLETVNFTNNSSDTNKIRMNLGVYC
jgi:hypothetical protein